MERDSPHLLDLETEVVSTLSLSGAERFDLLDCSPWRDGAGRFHLVGRWMRRRSADRNAPPLALGLARCTYPRGELIGRLPLEMLPTGNPCWYPDGSGRVVFAAGGRLYQAAFRGRDATTGADPAEELPPRPLPWRAAPPGCDIDYTQDLHWPSDGALALRCPLLASLSLWQAGVSPARRGRHLWWIDLGREGNEIVAAGLLLSSSDSTGMLARRAEERHPVVGTTPDGTAMLAYLVREHGCATWDLWLTPIARSAAGMVLAVPIPAGRKLAGGCEPVAPAFSADGRWVYAIRHRLHSGPRLERFPVAARDDFPRLAARDASAP